MNIAGISSETQLSPPHGPDNKYSADGIRKHIPLSKRHPRNDCKAGMKPIGVMDSSKALVFDKLRCRTDASLSSIFAVLQHLPNSSLEEHDHTTVR